VSGAIEATMTYGGQPPSLVRDYLVLLGADMEVAREHALRGWSFVD